MRIRTLIEPSDSMMTRQTERDKRIKQVISFAIDVVNLKARIAAYCGPTNLASMLIALKRGFQVATKLELTTANVAAHARLDKMHGTIALGTRGKWLAALDTEMRLLALGNNARDSILFPVQMKLATDSAIEYRLIAIDTKAGRLSTVVSLLLVCLGAFKTFITAPVACGRWLSTLTCHVGNLLGQYALSILHTGTLVKFANGVTTRYGAPQVGEGIV